MTEVSSYPRYKMDKKNSLEEKKDITEEKKDIFPPTEEKTFKKDEQEENIFIQEFPEKNETSGTFYQKRFLEGKLGYFTIDISIIEEVAYLERTVAEMFNMRIEEVQKRFLNIQNYRTDFAYSILPFAIIMKDYRSFLISSKEVFRLKQQRFVSL